MNLDEAKALEPMTEAELQAFAVLQMFEPQRWNVTQRLLFHNAAPRLLALAAAHKVMVEEAEKWRRMAFHPLGDNHHNAAKCPHCGDPLGKAESKAAVLEEQVARLRDTLDAIRRAYTTDAGCLPTCATFINEDDDCDCGYVEAADDVAEYARAALAAVPVQPKEGA